MDIQTEIALSLPAKMIVRLSQMAKKKHVTLSRLVLNILSDAIERFEKGADSLKNPGDQSAYAKYVNKRKHPRKKVALLGNVFFEANATPHHGTIQDISHDGVCFTFGEQKTDIPMNLDSITEIQFVMEEENKEIRFKIHPKRLEKDGNRFKIGASFSSDAEYYDLITFLKLLENVS